MEHRQRRPCHAGTLPAGTVAPGSVPAPAARHRNGEQTPPPTICTGTHPAQQIAPPVQTEGQSSSAPRAAALAFFFCPSSSPAACPACRISSPARAGHCAAVVPMTTPAHRSRSRSHRLLPAPGRISTASAAPDDHASSRPPHPMTTHQRQPCPPAQRPQPASLARTHSSSAAASAATEEDKHASAAHLPPPAIAAACRMIHPAKRPFCPAAGGVRFST